MAPRRRAFTPLAAPLIAVALIAALPAVAHAATATIVTHTDGSKQATYTAAPGETNVVTTSVNGNCVFQIFGGWQCFVFDFQIADSGAAITPAGGCSQAQKSDGSGPDVHAVDCPVTDPLTPVPFNAVIDVGDMNDTVSGPSNWCDVWSGHGCASADVYLYGGPGDDTLTGGDRNDVIDGGPGADTMAGGNGNDTVDYTGHTHSEPPGCLKFCEVSGVNASIDGVANDGATGYDASSGGTSPPGDNVQLDVENLIGSDAADTLSGDQRPSGTANNNSLEGRGGNDTIIGGNGADTLAGGAGDDTITSKDAAADNVRCGDGTGDAVNRDGSDTLSDCEHVSPVNVAAPHISGTARDGEILTAQTADGDWSGTAPLTYGYQWHRCDATGASCQDVGSNSASYTLGHGDVGKKLRATVNGSNSAGSDAADSALSETVGAIPPGSGTAPTITGTERNGETLAAHTADSDWTGSPPFTYAFQWHRCNANGGGCQDVGSNSATYVLGHDDVHMRLKVTVTASNPGGNAAADSDPTGVIQPAPGGSGPGGVGSGGTSGTPADLTPPTLALTVPEQKLKDVAKRGLQTQVSCSEAATITEQVFLRPKVAKRLGIKTRAPLVIGTATGAAGRPGRTTLTVRFARKMKNALKRARRVILVVRATATDAAGNRSAPIDLLVTLQR